jgi:outer membrane protein
MFKSGLSILLALVLGVAPLLAQTGLPRISTPVNFDNSQRVHDLMRAGNLYLSLQDALALAIENNLDIELQRFNFPVTRAELLRAKGGGITRGLNYILSEAPTGVGGPLSPVVTTGAATGRATSGTSIATNAIELGALGEPQDNLSVFGTVPPSNGTAVPIFDPALVGQLSWNHVTTPQSNILASGTYSLVSNGVTANAGVQQGFASGGTASFNFNNSRQSLNALNTSYNPYASSSLGLTFTQPLLRGFGMSLNRRFIRIAGNEAKIGSLLFQQQLISTVYGVVRLYTDFVALFEDTRVKQESVTLAEKLLSDTKAQFEEGTLAQVELTRANAQLFSTRQDLITARGLLEEQEAILKNVLTRRGNEDPEVRGAHIIPTDQLTIPATDEIRPMSDLIAEALDQRPDLGQGRLQIQNAQIGLEGAKSATRPEVDLVGVAQNNGLAGDAFAPSANPALIGGFGTALDQIFTRKYPTYGIGVQFNFPIHNRIAEADLARDELQVKQAQVRLRQMQNQARLEVEDALIAMRRSRASYEAATEAAKLQRESLEAEQAKFEVGASTAFFVIQYEALLAQARSTEVAAKSAYVKARAALQRAMGTILDENHISFDAAIKGKM